MRALSGMIVVVAFLGFPGCTSAPTVNSQRGADIVRDPFPEAQAAIRAEMLALNEIGRSHDWDALRAAHLHGPKFSEMGGGLERSGYEEMIATEIANVSAVEGLSIDWQDLKIDVFGDVAVATSFPLFRFTGENGEAYEQELCATMVYVNTHDGWKIAHEHLSEPAKDIVGGSFPEAQAAVKKEILAVAEALGHHDSEALRSAHLESPKFTKFGRLPGRVNFEETMVQEIADQSAMNDLSIEHRDLKIDVFGDVAVATFFPLITGTAPNGERVQAELRATAVWVETAEGWKIAHEHNTRMDAD